MRKNYDDYENEPRLEYENEFGEPWDFTPMDLVVVLFLMLAAVPSVLGFWKLFELFLLLNW